MIPGILSRVTPEGFSRVAERCCLYKAVSEVSAGLSAHRGVAEGPALGQLPLGGGIPRHFACTLTMVSSAFPDMA